MSSSGWRLLLRSAVAGSGGTTAPASPDARSSGSVAVLWSTSCTCLGPRRSTLVLRLPMKLVLGSLIWRVRGSSTSSAASSPSSSNGSSPRWSPASSARRVAPRSRASCMRSAATPIDRLILRARFEMEKPHTTMPATARPTSSTMPTTCPTSVSRSHATPDPT